MTDDRYRISIDRIETDADGNDDYRNVVDLMAPRAMLAAMAPDAVRHALAEPESFMRTEPAGWGTAEASPSGPADPPKRTRRTKAQIEADRAAAEAAAAAAPVAPAEPVPVPAVAPTPAAADTPAAPYNPFG